VTLVLDGEYVGGHEQHERPAQTVSVHMDEEGVKLKVFRTIVAEPWDRVSASHVDGGDSIETRFTMTRIARAGPSSAELSPPGRGRAT
jgi:hypothetical protein